MDVFNANKDPQEVALWMGDSGIPADMCGGFEGKPQNALRVCIVFTYGALVLLHNLLENEIDGITFLELTEADIKGLVPKLGVVKKIHRLQSSVSCFTVLHVQFFTIVMCYVRYCSVTLLGYFHSNGGPPIYTTMSPEFTSPEC